MTSCASNVVQHTVTFEVNGGTPVNSIVIDDGNLLEVPNSTKAGYTIEGWYSSINDGLTLNRKWDFISDKVLTSFTLYANWIPNQVTITFNTNGGNSIPTQTINFNAILNLPIATKVDYSFGGWFTDVDLTQVAPTTMPAQNINLYAKWMIKLELVSSSSSASHSTTLTSTGRVFMWGANGSGQLGDGTTTDKEVPTEITSNFSLATGEKVMSLSLGYTHSSALTSTGRVFMWGGNGSGQLGDGTTTDKNVPTEITSNFSLRPNDKIIGLSLGGVYSSALSAMGRVFVWGWNELGYLGDGTSTSRSIPTEITTGFSLFVGETIISLSKGSTHASALTSTGRVFMWGDNQYGYLGDGTSITRNVPTEITSNFSLSTGEKIISLSLGSTHSSALTSTGRVFMWGWNEFGQLGNGMNVNRNLPTEITSNFSLATGEKVMSLSLGYTHSSALTSTGRVFMWGGNGSGQLGDGTTTDKNVPTEITSNFSLRPNDKIIGLSLGGVYSSALSAMGRVFVWGWNELGYLGDGTSTSRSIPTEITTGFSLS
jgi:uncharacterized repeat protein (TIGR02543 family)